MSKTTRTTRRLRRTPQLRTTLCALLALAAAACGGTAPEPIGSVEDTRVLDLEGRDVATLEWLRGDVGVFVFVRADCPIANRYAPEISRLAEEYGARGVRFALVYVDPDETPQTVRAHLDEYGLALPALRDRRHELVEAAAATVTPTAAVVSDGGVIVYRGRIDDRFPDLGKARRSANRRDLAEALEDVLAGRRVEVPQTEAVGCFITDLEPASS